MWGLHADDCHRVGCVGGQVLKIVRVTGEDDAVWRRIRRGRDDRVHRGDASCPAGGGSQPCRVPGVRLVDGTDLAGSQQPVDVEVPAVVSGQCFGENHARNLRGPRATPPQFLQSCTLTSERAE